MLELVLVGRFRHIAEKWLSLSQQSLGRKARSFTLDQAKRKMELGVNFGTGKMNVDLQFVIGQVRALVAVGKEVAWLLKCILVVCLAVVFVHSLLLVQMMK